jgi:hypothetical protein
MDHACCLLGEQLSDSWIFRLQILGRLVEAGAIQLRVSPAGRVRMSPSRILSSRTASDSFALPVDSRLARPFRWYLTHQTAPRWYVIPICVPPFEFPDESPELYWRQDR